MSPVPPPGTDTSGSLYQDGLFSRITAIHFPKRAPGFLGGLFVSGASRYNDVTELIRGITLEAKDQDTFGTKPPISWGNLGVEGFGTVGEVFGGACRDAVIDPITGKLKRIPSFVLVGANTSGSALSYGVIMASNDGISWEQVYIGRKSTDDPLANGSSVFGVVWDGQQFWAGAHESENGPNPSTDVNEIDILLQSSDGFSWSEAGRNKINFYDWPSYNNRDGLLTVHCSSKVLDGNGNGVPGGIYGEKIGRSPLLIRPSTLPTIDYLFGTIGIAEPAPTVIRNGETIAVGIPITCVGNGGDVWVAGGGQSADGESAESACSFDDGKTWQSMHVSGVSAWLVAVIGTLLKPQAP